jgi:2-C-methyl-D-erythritol 4-phosphate cytidylyltransferase/2-C-methyl-D-erythritol 2,4-cyclodiphosphate synthase
MALTRHVDGAILVGIHDAARPFVSPALLHRLLAAAAEYGNVVPALALTDSIKHIAADGTLAGAVDRDHLRRVQTPQFFSLNNIYAAHERAYAEQHVDMTDDAAVAAFYGSSVHLCAGEESNFKITSEDDMIRAEHMLEKTLDMRVGHGFDVHAFTAGYQLTLGGIRIPYHKSLLGHSDADVVLHAITDAIYGALADGDIGTHFPPSDPQWKGAASDVFLRHALERVRQRDGVIAHIDATIICEEPKIGPHRPAMRERIASLCGLAIDSISIKATTTEGLGFTGRKEGIATEALVTLRLPSQD